MPPDDPESDGKKATGWQRYRFLIIIVGVIIAIVIAGGVLSNRNAPTSAEPAVTLSSVNAEVQDHETRLSAQELKAANATEDISDLWVEVTGLHTTIDSLPAPQNWAGEIMVMEDKIAGFQSQIDGLGNQGYPVEVTRVEGEYVDVTTMQGGSYLVMVTLYGSDLTSLSVRYPEVYTIPWQVSNNQTLSAVVKPQAQWAVNYTIELRVTGTVAYAAAVAGKGQGTGETGW